MAEEDVGESGRKKKFLLWAIVCILVLALIVGLAVTILYLTEFSLGSSDGKSNSSDSLSKTDARAGKGGRSGALNDDGFDDAGNKKGSPVLPPGGERPWRDVLITDSERTVNDAKRYCNGQGRSLFWTKDDDEENQLVGYVKRNIQQWPNCTKFFLGFQSVREKKFMSPDGTKYWPSLDTSFDSALPHNERTCAEVSLKSNLAVREMPCSEVQSRCYVCEYQASAGDCQHDPYLTSCYQHLILQSPKTAWIGYEFCEIFKRPSMGLMPIDKHVPPARRKYFESIDHPGCKDAVYMMATRYTHLYETTERTPMPYKSKRYMITEPNYDCLAIDSTHDYKLVTESCLRPNCAVCDAGGGKRT